MRGPGSDTRCRLKLVLRGGLVARPDTLAPLIDETSQVQQLKQQDCQVVILSNPTRKTQRAIGPYLYLERASRGELVPATEAFPSHPDAL